jgi:hypothetical protein
MSDDRPATTKTDAGSADRTTTPNAAPSQRDRERVERLVLLACDRAAARLAARHENDADDPLSLTPTTHPPDKLDLEIVKTLLPQIGKSQANSDDSRFGNTAPPSPEQIDRLLDELGRLGKRPGKAAHALTQETQSQPDTSEESP